MISPHSASETDNRPAAPRPPKIPRIESLLHRLLHAKDAGGQPLALLDELMLFLDDPPEGTGDRWQKGADLCESHGIKTSRMSVWRLYHAHFLQWRRDQNPPPPTTPPTPEEIALLHDQIRHLAAQRALDLLHDPGLTPGHLIGLLQNDNHRRKLELARDQFNDRVKVRERIEHRELYQRIDDRIREEVTSAAQSKFLRKTIETLLALPPDNTP
jgi:hypothetical protein